MRGVVNLQCWFQVYRKVNLLHVYLYPLFFRFFSHICCYNKDLLNSTGNSTQYSVVDPTFISHCSQKFLITLSGLLLPIDRRQPIFSLRVCHLWGLSQARMLSVLVSLSSRIGERLSFSLFLTPSYSMIY